MDKKKFIDAARMSNFAFSFGVTSVFALLLGFWAGRWLDSKLGSSPIFMLIGLLFGMAVTFQTLFSELKVLRKFEELEPENDEEDEDKK